MRPVSLWRTFLLLLALCALLPCSCAVPWMICATPTCNASLCLTGNAVVDIDVGNGGRVSECFQVANRSTWFATIACSTTSGVTTYNFFVSNSSDCTLAYTTHDWSGQSGQCVEGTDLTYYATVDCSSATSTHMAAGGLIFATALFAVLSTLALGS